MLRLYRAGRVQMRSFVLAGLWVPLRIGFSCLLCYTAEPARRISLA